jgi:large subunit ribosomal protein L25
LTKTPSFDRAACSTAPLAYRRPAGAGPDRPATIGDAMATAQGTALAVEPREPQGSRTARRLRRTGKVPGVVYGGGEDPVAFAVDARLLRQTLAHAGAVIDLSFEGGDGTPVVLKELTRHPVTGETIHVDLLRVRLDQAIHTTVTVELTGAEDAPGVKEGGVLEQLTREINIEALPTDIPDAITYDVSGAVIGDTITLEALTIPGTVTLLDDPETVLVTLSPPRLQVEEEPEIEEETELVGEGEGTPEGEGEAPSEDGGDAGGGDDGEGE